MKNQSRVFLALKSKTLSRLFRLGLLAVLASAWGCVGSGGGTNPEGYQAYFVYTADKGANSISVFAGDLYGSLHPVGTVTTPGAPTCVTTDDSHVFAVVGSTLVSYQIGPDGMLTESGSIDANAPLATGPEVIGLAGLHTAGTADSQLYVVTANNQLLAYTVAVNGTLTPTYSANNLNGAQSVTANIGQVNTTEEVVVGSGGDGTVTGYIDNGATLLHTSPAKLNIDTASSSVVPSVVMDSNYEGPKKVYALDAFNGKITEFLSDTSGSTASLTAKATVLAPKNSTQMVLGPVGMSLYVLCAASHSITAYGTDQPRPTAKFAAGVVVDSGASATSIATRLIPDVVGGLLPGANFIFVTTADGKLRQYVTGGEAGITYAESYDTGLNPVSVTITGNVGEAGYTTPVFGTTTLPHATVGKFYNQSLKFTGGSVSGFSEFKITNGSQPPGINVSGGEFGSDVTLGGLPSAAGTYTFTVTYSDGLARLNQQYTLVVDSGLSIATTSLSNGTVGQIYSANLTLAGGDGSQNATWSTTVGSLPAGLSFKANSSNEVIAGTPTTAGNYSFTVQAVQGSVKATQAFTMVVASGSTGSTSVRVLNAASDTNDSSLTLTLAGTPLGGGGFAVLGPKQNTTLANSQPYSVLNGASEVWTGNTFITAGNREILVPLGSTAADRKVGFMFNSPSVPGTVNGGITIMDGIPTRKVASVDMHLLDGSGAEVAHQNGLSYGSFVSFSFTPGSYQVKVTETGNPTNVLATSNLIAISAGQNYIDVAIVPEGSPGGVIQTLEN